MACCNGDGLFTTIDVGHAGRNSDGGVFRASRLGRWLERGALNLPAGKALPYTTTTNTFPYYFVADEAFPLKPYLMRPYPKRMLNNKKRIYNYRISRGRKIVEYAFGMMSRKFQELMSPELCSSESTINSIIQSVCVVYNFVRKREGSVYQPHLPFEDRDITDMVDLYMDEQATLPARDHLANYFVKPEASLPWQWKYCV
jgi:hypothetical protein